MPLRTSVMPTVEIYYPSFGRGKLKSIRCVFESSNVCTVLYINLLCVLAVKSSHVKLVSLDIYTLTFISGLRQPTPEWIGAFLFENIEPR